MSYDRINKLFSIFDDSNYYFNKSTKNDIVNSLLQRQFMLKESSIYNIFNLFETFVFSENEEGVRNLLSRIQEVFDINEVLSKNNLSFNDFFSQVINGESF